MVCKAVMDRVFIRLDGVKEKTDGGIILTSEYPEAQTVGIVISIGDKVQSVSAGDKVLFHVFDELPSCEKGVVVVRENSILGVITDE